jgi:hypothetical protein
MRKVIRGTARPLTVGDLVPGYEASAFHYGVGAASRTPAEIVGKLTKGIILKRYHINPARADPTIKARIAGLGGVVLSGSPSSVGYRGSNREVGPAIRAANIKPE